MDLAISVAPAGGGTAVAFRVDACDDTTVAELAEALGESDLYLGTRRLSGSESLAHAGVVSGVVLGAGRATAGRPSRPGPAEVAVVSGPAAGTSAPVRIGDVVAVGRSGDSLLRVDDPSVSRHHAEISIDPDGAWVRDRGSSNGVGVRGRRITGDERLRAGDVVQIGDSVVTVRGAGRVELLLDPPGPDGLRRFHRPPRIPPPDDDPELDCPEEPQAPKGARFPLVSVVAPALIGGAMFFFFRNPMFLAFLALSPVFAASNYLSDRRNGRADYKAKRAAYERARVDFDEHLAELVAAEEKARREALPDPAAIHRIATTHSSRLWERRPGDPDFLRLRVGLHDAPARVTLRDRAGSATTKAPVARLVPASFELRPAGVAGVAGSRPARLALARSLLTQAAVLHSPTDLRIVVLSSPDEAADWEWAAFLPH
ncbi:MAG: FHA domain-containing protein, partial [Acidimicrobiales bacterium]|nr:FHA domain-containing protein [Acidimicrobiales bacterium]